MRVEFSIDWYACVHITNEDIGSLYDLAYPSQRAEFTEANGNMGYTDAMINRLGAKVMWNIKRADMGIFVQYAGSVLNLYRQEGIDAIDIVIYHQEKRGRTTRLDLAIDVFDSGIKPKHIYDALERGKAQTVAGRKYSFIVGSDSGSTLYVGSRTSESMLRVYDKGVEMETEKDWLRVEIELKGNKAREAATLITEREAGKHINLAQRLVNGMIDWPVKVWQQIMTAEAEKLSASRKRESDTKTWLLELVAPSMGKYIARTQDKLIVEQFFEAVELYRKMADGWAETGSNNG